MEFATYADAVAYIHGMPRLRPNNGRVELQQLLAELGHPEKHGQFVHVTGTNGKGSTTCAIAHILHASGLHVGMFTSPFIDRFNERIQIDGEPIADETLRVLMCKVATAIAHLQAHTPGLIVKEFEVDTALGLLAFAEADVDVAVVEVGIGGEHDSTNVIMPEVAVITNVALDHVALLGGSLESIAHEKSGIIKSGVPVVTGPLVQSAAAIVRDRAKQTGSKEYVFGRDFAAKGKPNARIFGSSLDYTDADGPINKLEFPLLGDYQVQNAAVAVQAARVFATRTGRELTDTQVRTGLAAATWPARLERIKTDPTIVIDGGHNPDGLGHALKAVKALRYPQVTIIAGILVDKALPEMMSQLRATGADVILTTVPDNPRAASEADYHAAGGTWRVMEWHDALIDAIYSNTDGLILIIGSLYLASAVRQELVPQ